MENSWSCHDDHCLYYNVDYNFSQRFSNFTEKPDNLSILLISFFDGFILLSKTLKVWLLAFPKAARKPPRWYITVPSKNWLKQNPKIFSKYPPLNVGMVRIQKKNELRTKIFHTVIKSPNIFCNGKTKKKNQLLSWSSSGPEFCVIWLLKMPASGWGLLWESSSFAPWFILKMFRDVSGAVPERPWISGFVRKSSRCANAPSMRFSILLNSCDNSLVTLHSISSEIWVM